MLTEHADANDHLFPGTRLDRQSTDSDAGQIHCDDNISNADVRDSSMTEDSTVSSSATTTIAQNALAYVLANPSTFGQSDDDDDDLEDVAPKPNPTSQDRQGSER